MLDLCMGCISIVAVPNKVPPLYLFFFLWGLAISTGPSCCCALHAHRASSSSSPMTQ